MEQREGIKSYVSNVIINICKDPGAFRAQHLFLNKVNIILVQILKHDWPGRWRSFIPDLVAASKGLPCHLGRSHINAVLGACSTLPQALACHAAMCRLAGSLTPPAPSHPRLRCPSRCARTAWSSSSC